LTSSILNELPLQPVVNGWLGLVSLAAWEIMDDGRELHEKVQRAYERLKGKLQAGGKGQHRRELRVLLYLLIRKFDVRTRVFVGLIA